MSDTKIFIRGTGMISPQTTFLKDQFLDHPVEYHENFLKIVDPGFKNFIDTKLIRRMSGIIRMGVAAAKICLNDAGVDMPGAIITGTGLGCIEDTESFLAEIIQNNEQLLTPTAFIQSTHNTVAAQIALTIKCHASNMTYVHRGISFELAVHDAMMQLHEGTAENILTGGTDELTANTFIILKRLGLIKRKNTGNLNLYAERNNGTIYGEGAGFILLSTTADKKNYAELKNLQILFKPSDEKEVEAFILHTIKNAGLEIQDISLVIGGMNGDLKGDKVYDHLQNGILENIPWAGFKHLCGEYHTASSFAVWLGSMILKEQRIPVVVIPDHEGSGKIKNILVFNHYLNQHYIAYILQAC